MNKKAQITPIIFVMIILILVVIVTVIHFKADSKIKKNIDCFEEIAIEHCESKELEYSRSSYDFGYRFICREDARERNSGKIYKFFKEEVERCIK